MDSNKSYVTQILTENIYNSTCGSYVTQLIKETAYIPPNNKSLSTQFISEVSHSSNSDSRSSQLNYECAYPNVSLPSIPVGSQTTGSYQSNILAEATLQSYWKLDETSGTSIADSKGTNTGTSHSGCTLNQSSITALNTSIKFDGTTNAYISTANTVSFTSFTYELWFNIISLPSVSNNSSLLIGMTQSASTRDCCLFIDYRGYLCFYSGFLAGVISGGFVYIPLGAPLLNTWKHVAVTFASGSLLSIYLDGDLVFSFPTNQTIGTTFSAPNIKIGGDPNNSGGYFGFFNGYIDEVAVYTSALSQSAIRAHITTSLLGTSPYSISTQILSESIYSPSATNSCVSQILSESIYNVSLSSQVTQIVNEVAYLGVSTKSLTTQIINEIAHSSTSKSFISQLICEVAYPNVSLPSVPVGSETSGSYQSNILAESTLQSYWKLDETSGTSLADSKGTNTGTSHSGCTLNQTSITSLNKCIKFDGTTNAYISTANTLSLTTFTYELWFNITSLPSISNNSSLLAGFTTASNNRDCCLFIDYRGYLCFYSQSLGGVISGGVIYLPLDFPIFNTWRHVAVVCTANTSINIYLDGVLIYSTSLNFSLSTFKFKIGGDDTNNGGLFGFFNGYIDEVALYTSALSQSQIQAHITTSLLGTSPYSISTNIMSEVIYNTAYKAFKPNMPPHIFQFLLGQGIG